MSFSRKITCLLLCIVLFLSVMTGLASADTKSKTSMGPLLRGEPQFINISSKSGQDRIVGISGSDNPVEIRIRVVDSNGDAFEELPLTIEVLATPENNGNHRLLTPSLLTDRYGEMTIQFVPGSRAGTYYLRVFSERAPTKHLIVSVVAIASDWTSFLFMGLLGGMAMFLYGMTLGSKGLQQAAGSNLRLILGKLTNNRFAGLAVGTLVSGILQSSSAATVMVVSLVSASMMTLKQSLGVIIGANIGTAITIHLIAFKISNYALLMLAIGFFFRLFSKQKRMWHYGQIIMGFGFVFYGMHVMSLAVEPLRTFPQFSQALLYLQDYPFIVLVLAIFFTILTQSSGVTIGLIIVLSREGLVDLSLAVPVIMGAHIGTTSTALLASLSATMDGKRVALYNSLFSILGTVIFYALMGPFSRFVTVTTSTYFSDSMPRMIANANMFFVLGTAVVFILFVGPMATLLTRYVGSDEVENNNRFKPKYLSVSLLDTPELALDHVLREVLRMASYVDRMLVEIIDLINRRNENGLLQIQEWDDRVDCLEDAIRNYVIALSHRDISENQSRRAVALLYIADDIEHMGDVIEIGLVSNVKKLITTGVRFSADGEAELKRFHTEVVKLFKLVSIAIRKEDKQVATQVIEQKNILAQLERELKKSHLDRLLIGRPESIESGTIHMDLLSEFRRIITLSAKIAHTIIEEF